jgi:hypothetical protein
MPRFHHNNQKKLIALLPAPMVKFAVEMALLLLFHKLPSGLMMPAFFLDLRSPESAGLRVQSTR